MNRSNRLKFRLTTTATATKTSLKEVNSRSFNLYLDSFNLPNTKNSSGAEFLTTISKFRERDTKCTKKRDAYVVTDKLDR